MLNLIAVTVLVAGLGSAASIWSVQDRIDRQAKARGTDSPESGSPEDSRRYSRDVQLYYGDTGLLLEKWKRWLGELAHGKPLAYTIGMGSLVLALGLFYVADHRPPGPPPSSP
jgi:hypothetical protein